MTTSSRPRYSRTSMPTGASAANSSRPLWSSLVFSSAAEHSMPKDSTPRSLAFLILKSSPSSAPTMAKGTLMPGRALGAPHTTWKVSLPLLTWQTRSLSASGCCSALRISPTTTPWKAPATGVTLSTSRPTMDSLATRASRSAAGLAQLRSHCSLNFIFCSLLFGSCRTRGLAELRQEPQVVVEEQAQVIDAIAQHGQTLHAHAEGEALEFLGIDAGHAQHVRVHHAAAHDLQPAGLLADAAALAGAHHALHVDLGGWLGEREEGRTEAHAQRLLEEHPQEFLDGALQIREADALVRQQAFHLVEHRRVGDIRVAAIHASRADDADRRLPAFHGAHLHRRGVGAQQHVGVEVEGVVHGPGRVVAGNVERFEVMVVVLDFRTLGHAVADMGEELLDALLGAGHRVQAARGLAAARQGDVDTFGGQPGLQRGGFQLRLARGEGALDLVTGGIDARAGLGALLGGKLAEGLHLQGYFALLAQVLDPDLFEGVGVCAALHGLQRLGDQCIEIFHLHPPEDLAETPGATG